MLVKPKTRLFPLSLTYRTLWTLSTVTLKALKMAWLVGWFGLSSPKAESKIPLSAWPRTTSAQRSPETRRGGAPFEGKGKSNIKIKQEIGIKENLRVLIR